MPSSSTFPRKKFRITRAQRAAGDLIVDINHANMYFYVDHIRGLGDADGSGGSGSFSGAAIPTNLGAGGGRYHLEITVTNAILVLYAQDQTESPIHSYEGTGSASERLVGTYEGTWN